jgi:putative ABC transport system permease protein
VGQHLTLGNQTRDSGFEIIGIAADVHEIGLATDTGPEMYLPTLFRPQQTVDLGVRTSGNPMGMVAAVRAQVAAVDRDQPVSDIQTMEQVIDESLGQRRLTLLLLALFAGVALALAMLGIYGAIAYSVLQRTQELGIRRALGAQHADILRLVLRQGLTLAVAGVALGCGGAFALTRLMKTLLFQMNTADPATYLAVALVFVAVALIASYVPARRASKVDPMAALR